MSMMNSLRQIKGPGFLADENCFVENTAVQNNIRAEDLGRITADAIKSSHEAVADALAVLATELADNVNKIEQLKLNAEQSMKMCLDIAERARERGKADAERIEAASQRNTEIRGMIETMRGKIEE